MVRGWTVAVVVVVCSSLLATSAQAIPPFARRYGMSCSTCHAGGPTKLSIFGEAFRDNGYRIPEENESFYREPPMKLGDPSRRRLFPRTLWPGEIPAWVPLGLSALVRVDGTIPSGPSGDASSISFPAAVGLLIGGSLGRHFSFFSVLEGGTSGISMDQLYLIGRSFFERWLGEAGLNLKVGRMHPDLFAVQPRLNRAVLDPLPLTLVVGRDGFALANPTEAIEVYGLLAGRLKWVVAAANGQKPLDDVKTRRDLFGRLALKLGGSRFDYRGEVHSEVDTTVNLGAGAYWGVGVTEPSPPEVRFRNDLLRVLVDARLRSHGLDLLGQLVLGQDSDPDGLGLRVRHLAWSAEAQYVVLPWLQPYVRFEEARFDSAAHADRRRIVVGSAIFIRTNLRLRLEGAVGLFDTEPSRVIADLFFAM